MSTSTWPSATRADFENYQKRMQRDLATERRYRPGALAADLLPALDNLERAIAAAEQAGEKGPLVQGVAMVHTQLLDILRRHGITRIEAQGQPFDPNLHQAVMQQPSKDHPPMTVVQVLEQGYTDSRSSAASRARGRLHGAGADEQTWITPLAARASRKRRSVEKNYHADLRISVRRLRA